MAEIDEIRKVAEEIVERANDLRMVEVLGGPTGQGFPPQFVEGVGDSGEDDWERLEYKYRREIGDQDISQAGTEFDYIPQTFMTYAGENDLETHETVIEQLHSAITALSEEHNNQSTHPEITHIRSKAENWYGSFPTAFREEIASKMNFWIPNQANIIKVLALNVKAHWNIIEGARESLLSLAKATSNALLIALSSHGEYQGYGNDDIDSQKATNLALSIAGTAIAIGGVAVTAATGGTGAPLALSIFGALHNTANTMNIAAGGIETENGEPTKSPGVIDGSTVDEIIASMHTWLEVAQSEAIAEQEDHAAEIEKSIQEIESYRAAYAGLLVPYESAFATELPEMDGDQFRHAQ